MRQKKIECCCYCGRARKKADSSTDDRPRGAIAIASRATLEAERVCIDGTSGGRWQTQIGGQAGRRVFLGLYDL